MFNMIRIGPRGWEDGIFRSPLVFVGDYLRKLGFEENIVQVGLLITLAMNSARLGHPLSVVLEKGYDPWTGDLLNACKRIIPQDAICEVHGLKSEQLYKDQMFFRNKTLVCTDTKLLKKAIPDIRNLVVFGETTRQDELKGKFGTRTETVTAAYPLALVGMENSNELSLINHPSIIRVPGFPHGLSGIPGFEGDGNVIETKTIAKMFERMSSANVMVPFLDEVLTTILDQRVESVREKFGVIKKLINLCAILGNAPVFTRAEAIGNYIGVDMKDFKHLLASAGTGGNLLPGNVERIQAGKEDYYLATLLLANLIGIGSECFSFSEMQLFKIIKEINLIKASVSCEANSNLLKKITGFPRIPDRWAYMHEIMERLNSGSGSFVSEPGIRKYLTKLKKKEVIASKRNGSDKGDGYYILVPEINSYLKLPSPSEIDHPDFHDEPMEILNPITKEVETI
jgi:hypothetical protein